MTRVRLALILANERANLSSHLLFAVTHGSKRVKWPDEKLSDAGEAGRNYGCNVKV